MCGLQPMREARWASTRDFAFALAHATPGGLDVVRQFAVELTTAAKPGPHPIGTDNTVPPTPSPNPSPSPMPPTSPSPMPPTSPSPMPPILPSPSPPVPRPQPPPPPPLPWPSPTPSPSPAPSQSSSRRWRLLWSFVPIVGVVVIVAINQLRVRSGASAVRFWKSNTAPVLADVNRDGVEDVIGSFMMSDTKLVWIGAFDGKDLHERWRTGDIGTEKNAWSVRAGEHVVAADTTPEFHVLDIATGQRRFRGTLSDRPEQLCPSPDGSEVFIALANEKHVRVNVSSGAASPADRPDYCPARSRSCPAKRLCTDSTRPYDTDGFRLRYVLSDNRIAIGVGHPDPGTSYPMIIGYPLTGGAPQWKRVITRDTAQEAYVDVSDGTGFVIYETQDDVYHLQAFDPATGAIIWDVAAAKEVSIAIHAFVATPKYVYLSHNGKLRRFERATGAPRGIIGLQK